MGTSLPYLGGTLHLTLLRQRSRVAANGAPHPLRSICLRVCVSFRRGGAMHPRPGWPRQNAPSRLRLALSKALLWSQAPLHPRAPPRSRAPLRSRRQQAESIRLLLLQSAPRRAMHLVVPYLRLQSWCSWRFSLPSRWRASALSQRARRLPYSGWGGPSRRHHCAQRPLGCSA